MTASGTVSTEGRDPSLQASGVHSPGRNSDGEARSAAAQPTERRLLQLGRALREVAHQVRGPLGAVHLYGRLLREQVAPGTPAEHITRKLLSSVVHLSTLLEDLLLFAETGEPNRRPCYLLDVLEEALGFAEPYLQDRGIHLTRLYAGELEVVRADARLLASAFLNLVLNAVEAMPEGGELVVSLRRAPERAGFQEVRIEDTGPGFSAAALGHLFEPFYSEKRTGLGLGLAVARRIVEAHGGHIEAGNRARGGARVTVHLPAG